MAFVNKKKETPAPVPANFQKKEGKLELFGKKVDKKLLLIPAVILVLGLIASYVLAKRRQAGSKISSASSTVQESAQAVVRATSEAVQPVVEKAREVFRFGQSNW